VFSDGIAWAGSGMASPAGVASPSETESLFGDLGKRYATGIRWLEGLFPDGMRSEHFIVWTRTSFLGTATKVFGGEK
jgi:hypothetical protein